MAWTHSVSSVGVELRNSTDPTVVITTVSGDTLLVLSVYIKAIGESDLDGVPTDTDSDVYVEAGNYSTFGGKVYIFYVIDPTASGKTITVNTVGSCDTVINCASFQGSPAAALLGDSGQDQNTSSSTVSTSGGLSLVTTKYDSLIIAVFTQELGGISGGAADSSWGSGQNKVAELGRYSGAERYASSMTYEIVTSEGTNDQSITCTYSPNNNMVFAYEFKHAFDKKIMGVSTPIKIQGASALLVQGI